MLHVTTDQFTATLADMGTIIATTPQSTDTAIIATTTIGTEVEAM